MISIARYLDPSGPASGIANTPVVSCTENEKIRNSVGMVLNGFSRIPMSLDTSSPTTISMGDQAGVKIGRGPSRCTVT